jgi:hypothetical protein
MTQPDPGTLDAAREAAWKALDAAERAFPQCEHIREWRQRVDDARADLRAVLAAVDEAATRGAEPPPASSSLPAVPEPADDGALFPLEAA